MSPAGKRTTDPIAYDLFLKGERTALTPTNEAWTEAERCFELAAKIDPTFALPYAATGIVEVLKGGTFEPFKTAGPLSKEMAKKALELDPNLFEGHLLAGLIAMQVDLDWKKAELELRKAISIRPGHYMAHSWLAGLMLMLQRFDEAKAEYREAIRANPMDTGSWWGLVESHYVSGDILTATTISEDLRHRNPTFFSHIMTGYCYAAAGRVPDALHEADLAVGPSSPLERIQRALLYGVLGRPAEATQVMQDLETVGKTTFFPTLWLALLHAVKGEKAKALELLERDFKEGDRMLWSVYQFPQLDQLRSEPKFVSLLKLYDLPNVVTVRLVVAPHPSEGVKGPLGVSA